MPVLKDRLKNIEESQQTIQQQVAKETIRPTRSEAEIVQAIAQKISQKFRDEISSSGFTDNVRARIMASIQETAKDMCSDYEQQQRIVRIASVNLMGLGPIEIFMEDPEVTEIIVQRYDNICIEKRGIMYSVDSSFNDEAHLQNVINRIVQPAGRQINLSQPIVDTRLPNGSRVNATIPPVTPDGATLSIRKFSDDVMNGEDYIRLGSLNQAMLDFLSACVKGKISLIVSGGTSTGKTTLLNMLSTYIPANELIITIEDSCELQLHQKNVRRMEARTSTSKEVMAITTQALVKNALRMRPDRIIVGEIRDGTIVDMMSAMSTGHEGSMSTVHANNPGNLVNSRMPILYSMHDSVKFSVDAQCIQITEALQLIVHISRLENGKRVITHITHINGLTDRGKVKLNDIFVYNEKENTFLPTGYVPQQIMDKLAQSNILVNKDIFGKEETE